GGRARRALNFAYTLAFMCLLRFDEVLKIQSQDVELIRDESGAGKDKIRVTLPWRKTSQFGEIQPFVLHKLPEQMAHLCAVRAYADWIAATEITEGFVFRKLGSGGRVVANVDEPMV
ncbi:hypothetical protein BDZ89DRAFT_912104, partial [Hymenopellis radicata]